MSRVRGAHWGAAGRVSPHRSPVDTAFALDSTDVGRRAWTVLEEASERSTELMSDLESSASTAEWKVVRAASPEEAAAYVRSVGVDVEARTAVRSAHDILARMEIDAVLDGAGIAAHAMTLAGKDPDAERNAIREIAIHAGLGVTGVDYAVAETGSVVLLARSEVSRLPALAATCLRRCRREGQGPAVAGRAVHPAPRRVLPRQPGKLHEHHHRAEPDGGHSADPRHRRPRPRRRAHGAAGVTISDPVFDLVCS